MLGPVALLAMTAPATMAAGQPAAPLMVHHVPMRPLRLSAADMFKLAEVRQSAGDVDFVTSIYRALEDNPNRDIRAEARFRHAKLLLALKRNNEAATLLRRLLDERPDATVARLEFAHTLQMLGELDLALRQLRAAQASGLPPAVARLVDRYSEALRAARPMGASFEIAIAPDSNISRATRSDTLGTVFGDFDIDEDSKARSGTGLALRGQAYRRLSLGDSDRNLLLRASGSADLYRHGEFNDIAFDLAAGPEFRLRTRRISLEAGVTQRWYGQKPFTRSLRVGASLTQALGPRTQLRLSATAAMVDNRLNDLQDGKNYSGQVSVEHALSPSLGMALSLGADRLSAKDPGYSTTGWRAGLLAWREIGRATLTAQAEIGRLRADERLLLFPEVRSDRFSRFSLGASFRRLTVGGFAPTTRIVIERNRSTVEFYDYKRIRTEFGIARAF